MSRLMPTKGTTSGLLAVVAILAAACGGGTAETTTSTPESSTPETSTTTVAASTSTTLATPTTAGGPTTTTGGPTTTAGTTITTLAGDPIDFGPAEGDVLAVIGVRHDDVLNLRDAPGADQPINAGIPPTFNDLVALGNTRRLPSAFWIEVDYQASVGWVHMGFIAFEGAATDETSSVVDALGQRPVETTMTDLGRAVAEVFASDEEPGSDIVQVTPVTSGDLSEITYDVIGFADDAVRGLRIHVFAEQANGGFRLRTVEVTALCGRGVDEGGACI